MSHSIALEKFHKLFKLNIHREASFVRNFEEDTDRSGNLRYFFPEGCRGFDSLISPQQNPMTDKVKIPFRQPTNSGGISTNTNGPSPSKSPPRLPLTPTNLRPPKTPSVVPQPPQTPQIPKVPAQKPPKVPEKYLPPSQNVIPAADPLPSISTRGKYVTKAIPKFPPATQPPRSFPPVTSKPPPAINSKCDLGNCESQAITITMSVPDGGACVGCCPDEETMPKIVIPIKLKHGSGKSGSCPSYAKLILPADNVNVNSLKTNPTELARMVLQSIA